MPKPPRSDPFLIYHCDLCGKFPSEQPTEAEGKGQAKNEADKNLGQQTSRRGCSTDGREKLME
jgi:hypothetical protein